MVLIVVFVAGIASGVILEKGTSAYSYVARAASFVRGLFTK